MVALVAAVLEVVVGFFQEDVLVDLVETVVVVEILQGDSLW